MDNSSYLFLSTKQDYARFIDLNLKTLPALEPAEREELLAFQSDMIAALKAANCDNLVFQSSPLACENLWQSDFFIGLESLFRVKKLVHANPSAHLVCSDVDWRNLIVKYYPGINIVLLRPTKKIGQISMAYQSFRYLLTMAQPFNFSLKVKTPRVSVLFFSTWFKNSLATISERMPDPFFADLPLLFQSNDIESATFCHIEGFDKSCLEQVANLTKFKVFSYFNFLGGLDVLRILSKLLFSGVKLPQSYADFSVIVKKDLSFKKWLQSAHALMIKAVAEKFKQANPEIRFIHTYEGNCWEKGLVMAQAKTIGYQHTGVSPSFAKLNSTDYMPEMVFTSGPKFRDILVGNFAHRAEKVMSAVSLRQSTVFNYVPKTRLPINYTNILILLQGSPYDLEVLDKAVCFLENYNAKITIRQHPAYPINGLERYTNFRLSTNKNLYEDLQAHDLVLYNGTTAALEAAYLGVPCVYLDLGYAVSNNPFFMQADNLYVNTSNNYPSIYKLLESLEQNKERQQADLEQIQQYFNACFAKPDAESKQKFIQQIMSI